MTNKKIAFVTYPQSSHWVGDGFRVHNFVPSVYGLSMQEMDLSSFWIIMPRWKYLPALFLEELGCIPTEVLKQ
ncbi:hypothetical protein [Porphyromonas gingivicanis]|uniref:hypothetical protein n=1 Tax=Porphyromonas gingivicanis TaxID=266762 RepID=UPI000B0E2FD4|nr:hypothetical protein [Porphyromonas gingivicanis]